MDLERAESMIKALPFVSKTIVDDTLYEKVLSFLTLVLSTHSLEDIIQLNNSCQILEQIKQACLVNKEQDYRVTTLCIRLLGKLVYYDRSTMFNNLQTNYPDLLDMISSGITSSEGALRCACIEACIQFIYCPEGSNWLLHNNHATSFITFALLDQSTYVVAQACQLFSTLLKLEQHDLLEIMDPSNLILSILHPQCDQKQIISALEFCWAVVNIKEGSAMNYIRSKKLLHPIVPLLCSLDKIIRSRVIEILTVLFSYDTDPLQTLNLQGNQSNTDVDSAYNTLLLISQTMILESVKMDDLMTAVSLLESTLTLLRRCDNKSPSEAFTILLTLFNCCLEDGATDANYNNIRGLLKSIRLKNNLLQLVLRCMEKLVLVNPGITSQEPNFMELFNILNSESCYSDPRVLKASLILLATALYNMESTTSQQELLSKAIISLVKIMDDENRSVALDCKSLSIVLESFDNLLAHDQIGTLVTASNTAKTLAEALNFKFLDTEWDVRDAVTNFVGGLFKEPYSKTKINFALTFNLPLEVFGRIHDSEPYVRASAVEVLQNMMKCKEGWEYIQQHQQSRELSSKLPSMLYDTEAFVRRATLDAITCLVRNRSCQGVTMEIIDSKDENSLNPEILRRLINDQDEDVRIKTCTLIEKLWILYNHEKRQQKKKAATATHDQQEKIFFHHIHAAELLVDSAHDTNRVVRIEAYRVISGILAEHTTIEAVAGGGEKKRQLEEQDEFSIEFINKLQSVDMDRLKESLDPEHLYQEAFDINADMMIQSIVPTNPEDDMNNLDCE